MFDIDIAELARRSGVRASALRYYEDKGLIVSTGRRGLKRLFNPSTVERLSLIALGQASGFSLDEIAAMLTGAPNLDKRQLQAKAAELDRRIADLGRLRDGLLHAVACTAPSLMDCPRFRGIARLAGRQAAAQPSRRRFRAEPA
ncbi:helix-turn-helix domain-containing protein [Caulobacter soli]|uniref:helix-turn-helix domain-containing protein n=1 Tax=Caulobacter soli TaxID=2708539 RepID=UPI0013EA9928|nr:helix-turn-helix domain-containing protein [Caulobacter soli]